MPLTNSWLSKALDAGERTIKAIGRTSTMSVAAATYRAMEYEAFAKAIRAEQGSRRSGRDAVSYKNIAEAEETVPLQENASPPTDNSQQTSQQQTSQQPSPQQLSTGDYTGWDALLGNIGLDAWAY